MSKQKIYWPTTLFILGYHVLLLIGLPIYFLLYSPSLLLLLTSIALVFASGLSITAGYHRLYSHSTYKTRPVIEAVLLFFASLATQGSALQWCYDHRMHHAFVDTDKDPYSIKKGFWHAHILWMFYRSPEIDSKVVADLMRNRMLRFQHQHYLFCMLGANIALFLLAGWLFHDFVGAFFLIWLGRMFMLHHTTWFINSLAHSWGTQNYSQEHSAVDNYVMSLLTYGEGYHNYHHTFAHDYRNGIRWYHFDPTKWLIWILSKLGLAKDLKKVNDWRIAKQMLSDHKDKLTTYLHNTLNLGLEKKINDIGNLLIDRLTTLQTLYDKYKSIPKKEAQAIQAQIRQVKRDWKASWKEWKKTVKIIHKLFTPLNT